MSALVDLSKKNETSDLERCVLYISDPQKYDAAYIDPEEAAANLAYLQTLETRNAQLESALGEIKSRLDIFRDEIVRADMIVPMWVNDCYELIAILLGQEPTE